MKAKAFINQSILAAVLTIAALAEGQTAGATTKTVTYTLSSEKDGTYDYWALTCSGDTPFDGTTTVQHQLASGSSATFTLPDGFTFTFDWKGGTVTRVNSGDFYCTSNPKFSLSWDCPSLYVTNVRVTETIGTVAGLDGSGQATTDYNYVEQGNASYTLKTGTYFAKLVITYSDAPGLSIFESGGTNKYNIKDKDDLRHLADYVNNGHNDCIGLTFLQTTDITCDDTFAPIGNQIGFCGSYDGMGFTISGITVNRTGGTNADNRIGLFGKINYIDYAEYGTVRNVVLANSTFTGNNYVGGIVGDNNGIVQNCRVENDVTINAGINFAEYHGGIVGCNSGHGSVIGSVSAAVISNNGRGECLYYGGIAGGNSGIVKDCLYTGTTVTAYDYYGAIVGKNGSGPLTNNYYTAISLGGVGTLGGGGIDRDGARHARAVTLGENVALMGNEVAYEITNHSSLTAIGTTALRYNDGTTTTLYSGEGQTLTLSYTGDVPDGYSMAYGATAGTISDGTLTMPARDVTVIAFVDRWNIAGGATGDKNNPYIISTTEGFNQLADNVSAGVSYSGKFFKLKNNIIVNPQLEEHHKVGTSAHKFSGTFDGDGNTLTFYYHSFIYEDAAPFAYVDGATFLNLHVAGTITTANKYAAGIVAHSYGTTEITNCRSSVTIDSFLDGDSNHGGFVAVNEPYASLTIAGCLFDGKLLTYNQAATKQCGGFVGYTYGTESCSITNSLYDPAGYNSGEMEICDAESATFIRGGSAGANCYYTRKLGSAQGKQARIVHLGDNIVLSGTRTLYNVSGLTAIGTTALSTSDGTLYSGEGQALTLGYTGSVPTGYCAAYSATGGTISDGTLTMPNANVTVSASITVKDFTDDGHEGTYEDPYMIYNKDQLVMMASKTEENNYYYGKLIMLANDIDMSGVTNYNGSFVFKGSFYGNDKTISNLTINSSKTQVGLFGVIEDGCVANLTLSGATITGQDYVGGIAGVIYISGYIYNCHVVGSTITVNQSDLPCVGAIVGYNNREDALDSNTYHSTIVYAPNIQSTYYKADGTAFRIGVGYIENSNLHGDVSGAQLDPTQLFLADNRDNTDLIAAYADPANHVSPVGAGCVTISSSGINVTLTGRKLYKDGAWNTLCLPFDVSTTSGPLSGDNVVAMTLDADNSGLSGTTLTLNFDAAPATIPAGTPFIIKWSKTNENDPDLADLVNPLFTVFIKNSAFTEVSFTGGKFKGTYSPVSFNSEDKSILFLGANNKLYYPDGSAATTINAFRAYFQLNGVNNVREFRLNFGEDDEVDEVNEVNASLEVNDDSWYDLSGRRLGGKPTQSGLYIYNGKKVLK